MQKSKSTAIALGLILGALGVHRFYLGYTGTGLIMAAITVLTVGVGSIVSIIWSIVDVARIICDEMPDAAGHPLLVRPVAGSVPG